jgi:subtilisin family serine protease
MGLAKRLAVVVLLLAALPTLGAAGPEVGAARVTALAATAWESVPDELLTLPPDPRPWSEKVAPGLLAAALERRGEVECLVTLRSPEILADFRQVPFDHRDRLRWIARSGDELDHDLRPAGVTVLTRYSHLPVLHVRVPADALSRLAADPRVEAVSPNRVARATRTEGKALMRTSQPPVGAYTGAGVTVAVLDTGVDYTHTELSPGGTDLSAKTIKGADVIDGDNDPMDGEGHGTAVAGIIAGASGGVAPSAKIYAVRILDNEGNGTGDQIIAGVNDVVSRVSGGNPLNIKVANMSLGGYFDDGIPPQPCDDDIPELAVPFSTLGAAGVLPVASGGNGGCTDGVAWPACITSTLAVGAVYDANIGSGVSFSEGQCIPSGCTESTTAADMIACFNDSGAELDVWAPSFCATTTAKGGGYDGCFGGTSASAPYASGVAALLTQAVPARGATALHSAITNSGVDLTDTRNGITRKSIRADSALTALQSGCTAPAVPGGVALDKSSACSGTQFTLSWNAVSGAVSYKVQVATDANFTSVVTLTPTDTFTGTAVNLTLTGSYVGPLYMRVRANASCGASSQYSGAVQLQFTGTTCGSSYAKTYYLSGVAHTPGVAPAFWYSDTAILNAGTSSVQLRISFNGVNSTPAPLALTLAAHQQVTWNDVLLQAFGSTTSDAGVIVVEATGPVIVLGRTYAKTTPTALSYGSAYPGMEAAQALSSGQVGYLAGLRSDANFRTNVEAVNVGTVNATVEFRFLSNAGAPVGTTTLAEIAPGKRASQTRALPSGQSAAFAEVRVTPTGAKVLAFATVMDADANATDPTTIELRIP